MSHQVTEHREVCATLDDASLTVEHPFRASRMTLGATILDLDGRKHAVAKRVLSRSVSAERLRVCRGSVIEPAVRDAWARLRGRGRVDVVSEFAVQVPPVVIFGLLDLPTDVAVPTYVEDMRPIIDFISDNHSGYLRAQSANDRLVAFIERAVAEGRSPAIDDLLSAHAAEGLTRQEAIAAIGLLLLAATETTICALSNVFYFIGEFPDSWTAVSKGDLSPQALVEEILRFEPPVRRTFRFVRDAATVANVSMRRGAVIEVCLTPANHSDDRIEAPDEWGPCPGRGVGVTFGFGRHSCIGKTLAIAEMLAVVRLLQDEQFSPGSICERPSLAGVTFRRPPSLFVQL